MLVIIKRFNAVDSFVNGLWGAVVTGSSSRFGCSLKLSEFQTDMLTVVFDEPNVTSLV